MAHEYLHTRSGIGRRSIQTNNTRTNPPIHVYNLLSTYSPFPPFIYTCTLFSLTTALLFFFPVTAVALAAPVFCFEAVAVAAAPAFPVAVAVASAAAVFLLHLLALPKSHVLIRRRTRQEQHRESEQEPLWKQRIRSGWRSCPRQL